MIDMRGEDKRPNKKALLFIGAGLVAAIVLIVVGLFVWDYLKLKGDPNAANKERAARVSQQVGTIFEVPKEEPTVVLVEDKEKLKGQEFFDKAENGDYLLIYKDAKLAMLYREKIKKLINVGPINLPDQSTPPAEASDQTKQ